MKTRAGDDLILSSRAQHTTEGVGSIISELSIDIKEILVANDDLHFLGGSLLPPMACDVMPAHRTLCMPQSTLPADYPVRVWRGEEQQPPAGLGKAIG